MLESTRDKILDNELKEALFKTAKYHCKTWLDENIILQSITKDQEPELIEILANFGNFLVTTDISIYMHMENKRYYLLYLSKVTDAKHNIQVFEAIYSNGLKEIKRNWKYGESIVTIIYDNE